MLLKFDSLFTFAETSAGVFNRQSYNFSLKLRQNSMQELDKKFYKIGDVAQILNIPESTLRYWEKQFTVIKPRRNAKNIRFYTPADIEMIRKVHYLVKEKGLKLDAAQEQIRHNRDGVDKRFEVVDTLQGVKQQLLQLQKAFEKL